MIPRVMVDFLNRASVAVASTRDETLTPSVHWVSGWKPGEDGESVICLIPPLFDDRLTAALVDGGPVALAVEVIGPHECYQFKGRHLATRAVEPADHATYEACRQRFVDAVRNLLGDRFTAEALRIRFRPPTRAVRFRVEEIYLQTPGPGAGGRVYPAQES